MRGCLIAIIFALLALAPGGARADVSGPACIVDGDTMSIGGKRANNRCNGGVFVKIFGIDAPELDQTCLSKDKKIWQCGLAAGSALLRMTRGKTVDCKGSSKDKQGRVLSRCTIGDLDLGGEMVRAGFALADPRESQQYVGEQENAQIKQLGIWLNGNDSIVPPRIWRKRSGRE
ncbi:MAG: hypothetical protein A2516_03875 [Alphaproteobacteria bacterium RIFOXYD12_FULL_60_8]|nr:MAG: hypothetical protein A2516_03875 [Alphaproteobacteria bacterium RIFOXYD12_FULL_60_8]